MKTSRKERERTTNANAAASITPSSQASRPRQQSKTPRTKQPRKQPHTKDAGLPPKPARRAQDAERVRRPGGVLEHQQALLADWQASRQPAAAQMAEHRLRLRAERGKDELRTKLAQVGEQQRELRALCEACAAEQAAVRVAELETEASISRHCAAVGRELASREHEAGTAWRAQRRRSAMRWGGTAAPQACGARRWPRPWPTAPPPSRCRTDGTSSRAGSPRSPCSMRSSRCRPATRTRRSELRPRHRYRAC